MPPPFAFLLFCRWCCIEEEPNGQWLLDDLWPYICWGHMCNSTVGSLCLSLMVMYQVPLREAHTHIQPYRSKFTDETNSHILQEKKPYLHLTFNTITVLLDNNITTCQPIMGKYIPWLWWNLMALYPVTAWTLCQLTLDHLSSLLSTPL